MKNLIAELRNNKSVVAGKIQLQHHEGILYAYYTHEENHEYPYATAVANIVVKKDDLTSEVITSLVGSIQKQFFNNFATSLREMRKDVFGEEALTEEEDFRNYCDNCEEVIYCYLFV